VEGSAQDSHALARVSISEDRTEIYKRISGQGELTKKKERKENSPRKRNEFVKNRFKWGI